MKSSSRNWKQAEKTPGAAGGAAGTSSGSEEKRGFRTPWTDIRRSEYHHDKTRWRQFCLLVEGFPWDGVAAGCEVPAGGWRGGTGWGSRALSSHRLGGCGCCSRGAGTLTSGRCWRRLASWAMVLPFTLTIMKKPARNTPAPKQSPLPCCTTGLSTHRSHHRRLVGHRTAAPEWRQTWRRNGTKRSRKASWQPRSPKHTVWQGDTACHRRRNHGRARVTAPRRHPTA